MKTKSFLLATVILVFFTVFTACVSNPQQVDAGEVSERVITYFYKNHQKNVVVESVESIQIDHNSYRYVVNVSENETKYSLFLDQNNNPLFDDVSAEDKKRNLEIIFDKESIETFGLKFKDTSGFYVEFSYPDKRCTVNLLVSVIDRPNIMMQDSVYSFLHELSDYGVDILGIAVSSPDFLLPKMEFGHGVHGVMLESARFNTDINRKAFNKSYADFVNSVFWDKQKFEDNIYELTQLGYKNVYFFISTSIRVNSIEIILYCESDINLTDEIATALLMNMDDSYLKISKRETKYTLQHVYNSN